MLFLLLFLFPQLSLAESPFRDPIDFIHKAFIDASVGPGYTAGENFRIYNNMSGQRTGTTHKFVPLYDLRVGPVNFTNVFSQPGFTKGDGLRLGILVFYTGDEYKADTVEPRKKSLFAGGFAGYGPLTLYAYSNVMKKHLGSIYAARLAPKLLSVGKNSAFYLVMEAQHMNRPYVNYYFGVRDYEGTAKIPAYEGARTTNYSATLLYLMHIGKRLDFLFWGGEKRFGRGITDSPTVGLPHEYRAGIGFIFKVL